MAKTQLTDYVPHRERCAALDRFSLEYAGRYAIIHLGEIGPVDVGDVEDAIARLRRDYGHDVPIELNRILNGSVFALFARYIR